MAQRAWLYSFVRVVALAFVIATVHAIDFAALTWSASLASFAWLLLMGLLQATVLGYVLVRSVWRGWKLVAAWCAIYFGITVFQTQIEAIVFLQYFVSIIPVDAMPAIVLNDAIRAMLIAPLAVVIFDRFKPSASPKVGSQPLRLTALQWIWKTGALAVIYVFIYLLFGLVVAKPLAGTAFDEYYGNLQLPGWFLPFQLIRGVIWVLITIPIIRMMRASSREIALGVALMLSVPIASLVIPSNEFMPAPIRFAHLVELFTSMFVFGWIDHWLLTWRRQPKAQQTNLRGASHPS